jgi:Holliday junction resolvase RusA-like endonuclease
VIEVDVAGRPAPKGSRIAAKTKAGKPYTYPASKHERPWVDAVKRATQIAMRHNAQPAPPYVVELDFRLQAPKRQVTDHPTAHDLDKLARSVVDGLVQGGAIEDDRHVTVLTARKRYAVLDECPGVRAVVVTHSSD